MLVTSYILCCNCLHSLPTVIETIVKEFLLSVAARSDARPLFTRRSTCTAWTDMWGLVQARSCRLVGVGFSASVCAPFFLCGTLQHVLAAGTSRDEEHDVVPELCHDRLMVTLSTGKKY